jgi:8-oxo-dGTP diphosphatase/2-hydroxy-dATP diphosphatase
MQKKRLTLTLVRRGSHILLGMKKRGFGEGRWNGFGGKVMQGETVEGAALRELHEEAGITAEQLEKVGVLDFQFTTRPDEELEVHVFGAGKYTGEPCESEEMRPAWFSINALPYPDMWPDDIFWMPLYLAGKKFTGRFVFDAHDNILEQALEEIPNTQGLPL